MVQKCGVHQLRLVGYPIIYRVLYIPGGCLGFLPSTVWLFGLGIFGFHMSSRDGKPNIIGVMDLETTLGTNFWRNFNQLKFWTLLKRHTP